MNKYLIFAALLIVSLSISNAYCTELRDTYHNGIYYDHNGQPENPAFFNTSDTSFQLFSVPDVFNWPTGITKESENFYWMADNDADSSKLHKVFYRMGDANATVLGSYDAPLLGYAGLAYDGEYLWAVYEHAYKLFKIDRTTGAAIDSFQMQLPDSLNPDRHAWGICYDGENYWHSQYGQNSVIFKLDPTTMAVVDSIVPTTAMVLGLTYSAPYLYGIDILNSLIIRYDPVSLVELDEYDWDVGYPLGIHFDETTGNFINVSSKIEFGGDETVYMIGFSTSIDEPSMSAPREIELSNAYPNPFNASTNISFSLNQPSNVTLDIYDILGRKTESLVNEYLPTGDHSVLWNAGQIPSGIYFYRITTGEWSDTRKVTLLK